MNPPKPRRTTRRTPLFTLATLTVCGATLWVEPARAAGWLDALFGKSSTPAEAAVAGPGQRIWQLHEFTTVALVPREPGSAPNRQPTQLQAEGLRQQLALVHSVGRDGSQVPLFAADELAELARPLAQALEKAGPGDDVLLLSASRRDGGVLAAPSAVTARLFVQDNQLQLVVHDARFEFYDAYRGTHVAPRFTFGSRRTAGEASIRSAAASNVRADWLSLPLQGAATATAAAAAASVAAPAAATLPVPTAPAARRPMDAAGAEDIERRLETLKRLREKNLITEDEYQQKRKEILQLL